MNKQDEGVTFVETLISLILLSLLMLLLFRLGSTLLPGLSKDRLYFSRQRQELLLYNYLKQSFNRIEPPWWLAEYEAVEQEEQWQFPWFDGEEDSFLRISYSDETFLIQQGDQEALSFYPAQPVTMDLITQDPPGLSYFKISIADHNYYFSPSITPIRGKDLF